MSARRFFLACFLCFSAFVLQAQAPEYQVILTDGRAIDARLIEHVDEGLPTEHLLINGTDKIGIKMVGFYQIPGRLYMIKEIGDMGYKKLLLIEKGEISLFTFVHELYDPHLGGGKKTTTHTVYMYKNVIKPFNMENLKNDLEDQPETIKKLKKIKRTTWIKTAVVLTGIGLIVNGLDQMMVKSSSNGGEYTKLEFSPNPSFVGGVALVVAPLLVNRRGNALMNFVQEYNAQAYNK